MVTQYKAQETLKIDGDHVVFYDRKKRKEAHFVKKLVWKDNR